MAAVATTGAGDADRLLRSVSVPPFLRVDPVPSVRSASSNSVPSASSNGAQTPRVHSSRSPEQ